MRMEDRKVAERTKNELRVGEEVKKENHLLLAFTNQEECDKEFNPRRLHLYLTIFILNLNYSLNGVGFAWSSPVLVKLPLSDAEGSNVAAMLCLGSIPSPFIAGVLLNIIGRKGIVGLNASIATLSTIILLCAGTNITILSIGRFLHGMVCGITFAAAPSYIAEVSENSLRKLLNTLSQVFCCGGSLMVYVVGPFVSYTVLHYIILGFFLVVLFLFPLLPNSPYYLVMKNDMEEARKCLTWLREGRSAASIEKELIEIQDTIQQNEAMSTSLSSLITLKGNRKALSICMTLVIFQQFSGVSVIFFYSEKIIRTAGTNISGDASSIIIGVIMMVSAFISPLSVKYFGYKKPLIVSSLGMCLGMAGLGVFFMLKTNKFKVDHLGWLPLLSIVVYVMFFNSGFANIPWALSGELFPSDVKPMATTAVAITSGTAEFLMVKLFPDLIALLGIDFLFLSYACFCSFALVFAVLVVNDTSNMTFTEIQELLNRSRKNIKV